MQKIKQFLQSQKGKDILVVFIVILVGLGSFELGRLSKQGSSEGIKIEYNGEALNQPASAFLSTDLGDSTPKIPQNATIAKKSETFYFASKRGHKYYPAGCSAGKSLKQENRIYFATRAEAETAGYELSGSCK